MDEFLELDDFLDRRGCTLDYSTFQLLIRPYRDMEVRLIKNNIYELKVQDAKWTRVVKVVE